MQREYQNIDRCRECGSVTRVLIFEHGLDDQGDEYKALWGEDVPHSRHACSSMVALSKEEWPCLF